MVDFRRSLSIFLLVCLIDPHVVLVYPNNKISLSWSYFNLQLGSGSVLIDVLNPKKNDEHSATNFASSVIKEKLVEDGHVELEVPDTIVGAVLGPKAKTLIEIQHLSGCKVEVHKRGTAENVSEGYRLIRSLFSLSFELPSRYFRKRLVENLQTSPLISIFSS